jgi:hypothetical protein
MPLLRSRPIGVQVLLAGLVPAAFGALCGWLLGVNKTAYLIASAVAIAGGYFAGKDHDGAGEGALRGLVGGSLFGGFILIVHEATGKAAKAKLPHPSILLLVVTVGAGVVLGALGGAARHRQEEAGEKAERPPMDLSRLEWSEYLGFAGAAVLFGALFLPWFSTSCDTLHPLSPKNCNPHSVLHSRAGDFTAFQTYTILDILLCAACAAPFILAYLLVRQAELSWRPGEITMIVGMLAAALILLNGIILGKPGGTNSVDLSIEPGYLVGMLGASMILAGGVLRQALYSGVRKPPGVF